MSSVTSWSRVPLTPRPWPKSWLRSIRSSARSKTCCARPTVEGHSSPGPTRSPSPPTWSPTPSVLRRCGLLAAARPGRRPHRPRRAPVLGPGGVQEAGGETSFPWHQDNGYAFLEPQQYLTCWIALTDATRENGCPWVVPGLHSARHARPQADRHRLRVPRRTRRTRFRPGAGRQHRGVLVVDPPLHRTQPHRRRPQGLHRAVRPRRRRGPPRRRRRRDPPVHPPTTPGRQFPVLRDGVQVA